MLTKACFIITDYTYIMHVCKRRRDEKCFLSENAIIKHFNLVQSVIVIYQNPRISAFQK